MRRRVGWLRSLGRPSEVRAGDGRTPALSRRMHDLRRRWSDVALVLSVGRPVPNTDLGPHDLEQVRGQLRDCLEGRGGEVSARARAVELGRAYLQLSSAGRRRFLELLATEFDVDEEAVLVQAAALGKTDVPTNRRTAMRKLRKALEPPRIQLLTQFNALPDGTKFLVDMRADLRRLGQLDSHTACLQEDLEELLRSWFDIGFLELRRITWDSPASLLERLARSEAVHTVTSWADLKNRLDTDRRLFAFFHPRMPDEPLIFVEVALVCGLAGEIAPLLDKEAPLVDPNRADTAIFYSISNAQRGLDGISFGAFLIKSVVDELSQELPNLRAFATLSPIPGLRAWIERPTDDPQIAELQQLLQGKWDAQPVIDEAKPALLRLCATYLLRIKRDDGRALDPVANFHLTNGARVERINWLADRSRRGFRQSAGMMVNYAYRLSEIEANHESYTGAGLVVASNAVTRLARDGRT